MKNSFLKYFTDKNKLSLRNIRTGEEMWHLFTSRLNMILGFMTLVVILFVVILTTVAYTPILDLIPGYPGNKARKILLGNIAKLDSLERQIRVWDNYHYNLIRILDGQSAATVLSEDSTQYATGIKGQIIQRSYADSLLRQQMTTDSNYVFRSELRKKAELTFEMLPPVKGMIVKSFSPKASIFGVEITPAPNQVVLSVLDGTVTMESWSPATGYMMMIQHAGNMVSIYKYLGQTLFKTGDRVKAGEAIAMTGMLNEGKIPHFVFELWYNGNAVDPENYITF